LETNMFVALSILLALGCLLPAGAKLAAHPKMQESARRFGIPWPRYRLIGVAELAAAAGVLAGLWWHPIGVAAAAGMAVLLLGALVTHRRAGDSGKDAAPAVVILALAVAYLVLALAG
jgi:DoxX-like family